ncbi:MAG: hypothetical protein GY868_17750, partial [Deltaproteobacteria bacterium]|nr:hypothetical protein [Deltaproteobacteria bacterium]
SVTPYVGCPVNAAPEVIRAVSEVGGFVADEDSAAGTMQVLQHYLE